MFRVQQVLEVLRNHKKRKAGLQTIYCFNLLSREESFGGWEGTKVIK